MDAVDATVLLYSLVVFSIQAAEHSYHLWSLQFFNNLAKPMLGGRPAVAVVHGHGQPDVEVLVEHLAAERYPLAEHVHRHEAERLPVH